MGLVGDVDKFLISSGVLSFIEWILIVSKRNVRRSFMLFRGFKSGHCPALRSAYDPWLDLIRTPTGVKTLIVRILAYETNV